MTALTTSAQISTYRLATLRTALKLEKLGMNMSRGPTALSILRGMGYKGKRDAILAQVTADVATHMAAMEEGTVITTP